MYNLNPIWGIIGSITAILNTIVKPSPISYLHHHLREPVPPQMILRYSQGNLGKKRIHYFGDQMSYFDQMSSFTLS